MISKLVAWAEDRPRAIARMRRALGEYLVAGIKTTLPFFTWLLAQPEFLDGRFHTTYLDEVLKARNGLPFVEPVPTSRTSRRSPPRCRRCCRHRPRCGGERFGGERSGRLACRRWRARARAEGLRGA